MLNLHRLGRQGTSVMAVSVALACAGNPPPNPGTEMDTGPVISSFSPSSGPAGEAYPVEVTIEGVGFEDRGNIVTFGGISIEGLESSEGGTKLRFWVPKEYPSTGEAPPQIVGPGEYLITVTTSAGTSDAVTFTVTRGD